jgi:hypothetical protein
MDSSRGEFDMLRFGARRGLRANAASFKLAYAYRKINEATSDAKLGLLSCQQGHGSMGLARKLPTSHVNMTKCDARRD